MAQRRPFNMQESESNMKNSIGLNIARRGSYEMEENV